MPRGYDKSDLQKGLLVSLPFDEGIGTNTHDIASPHHPFVFGGVGHNPTWVQLSSGLWVLNCAGADPDYIYSPAASNGDIEFTSSDFTIVMWIYPTTLTSGSSKNMISCHTGTYSNGWVFYLSGGSTGQYNWQSSLMCVHGSSQWVGFSTQTIGPNVWYLVGGTRTQTMLSPYINGRFNYQTVVGSPGNPDAYSADCRIACRSVDLMSPFYGYVGLPRIWNRALSPAEHMEIFNRERDLFGV